MRWGQDQTSAIRKLSSACADMSRARFEVAVAKEAIMVPEAIPLYVPPTAEMRRLGLQDEITIKEIAA